MFDLGVVIGKFAPLTLGHINLITEAAVQSKHVLVVLSHDQRWLDKQSPRDQQVLNFKNRLRWLQQTYADTEHVTIDFIDEASVPEYPNGWQEYAALLGAKIFSEAGKLAAKHSQAQSIAIFSSELDYDEKYKTHLGFVEHVIVDSERTRVPISATKVRDNLYANWEYLPSIVRKDYCLRVVVMGVESCVDGETEFFNGTGWKKISDYVKGDRVLQYNSDKSAELVIPERYIKEPCNEFIKFQNSYGTWSQVVTEDHDMVYLTSKGNVAKKKASDVAKIHFELPHGFRGKFIPSFNLSGEVSYDEMFLRLLIAISADGSLSKNKKVWNVRIKKHRKIERLTWILKSLNVPFKVANYKDGFHNFVIPSEYGTKIFPKEFYNLDEGSKKVFMEEIFLWDGYVLDRKYFSVEKENIDIVQFIFSSSNFKTRIIEDIRDKRRTCYTLMVMTTPIFSMNINDFNDRHRSKMVSKFTSKDGLKYCFTVPSGMLVLRRDNQIFVTGNCGKSSLVKNLAKLYNTSWVEEYGRTYCETVLAGSELTLRSSDYPLIAYRHKELEEEALRTSNRLCFVDTNAFVTEYYHRLYEGKPNPIVSAIAAEEQYDLVLILSPEVPWVDDGLRLNPDREKTGGLFQQMLQEFKNQTPRYRTVYITGDSYKGRLDQARVAVDQLLAFNEGFLGWDALREGEPGKFQPAPSGGSFDTDQAMVDSIGN